MLEALDLRHALLVGHSMGCNEIVRYLSRHGGARVSGAALLATMTPFVLRTPDNPDGIDEACFTAVREEQLMVDFPKWIDDNMEPFVLPATPPGMRRWVADLALRASLQALCECHRTLVHTDMREEMARIALPVLLVAGKRDVSAPFALTADASARLLPNATLRVYEDAPHGMFITHAGQVNRDLLEFAASLQHNPPTRTTEA